jgi:hypothetical protein
VRRVVEYAEFSVFDAKPAWSHNILPQDELLEQRGVSAENVGECGSDLMFRLKLGLLKDVNNTQNEGRINLLEYG